MYEERNIRGDWSKNFWNDFNYICNNIFIFITKTLDNINFKNNSDVLHWRNFKNYKNNWFLNIR